MNIIPGEKKANHGTWTTPLARFFGYYLTIKENTKNETRIHIGFTEDEAADNLERYCDKWLSEDDGYEYVILRCDGIDKSKGNLSWSNLDHTNQILSVFERG